MTLSVPLGSIPELPAKSCQEIKANEEGQVVSGKYWFYSIIPGTSVFAYCNMTTDGMLKGGVNILSPIILEDCTPTNKFKTNLFYIEFSIVFISIQG